MGNWKELGEVPDSDDEDFDTEDSQEEAIQELPQQQDGGQNNGIWDVPSSPPKPDTLNGPSQILGGAAEPSIPADEPCQQDEPAPSSPLTELNESPRAPGWEPEFIGGSMKSSPRRMSPRMSAQTTPSLAATFTGKPFHNSPPQLSPRLSPRKSLRTTPAQAAELPCAIKPQRDEISTSVVQITESSASPFPGHSIGRLSPQTVTRELQEESRDNGPPKTTVNTSEAGTSSPMPGRLGRSLRPRKPIQEHPYLLENMQYSHVMKSHGVKPIRVAPESQNMARTEQEDESQERDFTNDESQSVSGGAVGDETQEAMQMFHSDPFDDIDELALSPSPRTSSPRPRFVVSSQPSNGQQTDNTSLSGDDEFPSLNDLGKPGTRISAIPSKHHRSPKVTKSRKRQNTGPGLQRQTSSPPKEDFNVWDFSPSPQAVLRESWRDKSPSSSVSPVPASRRAARLLSKTPTRQPALRSISPVQPVDLTSITEEDGSEGQDDIGSSRSASDSEADVVRQTSKRIRGVLPASWLRLDQGAASRKAVQKAPRRMSPEPSPAQPRRGLAVMTHTTSRKSALSNLFLDDDNDDNDNDDITALQGNDSAANLQPSIDEILDLDDGASVVEEDVIDRMLPGRKRNQSFLGGPPVKRRKTQSKVFKGESRQHYRQQKITKQVTCTPGVPSGTIKSKRQRTVSKSTAHVRRAVSPPQLSIVDVVEPNAPSFVKIAARAARGRKDMGRSKPTSKRINLGIGRDNVDALSVLSNWKSGKIKQKTPQEPPRPVHAQPKPPVSREPLRQLSTNITKSTGTDLRLSFVQPRKLAIQPSIVDFVIPGDEAGSDPNLRQAKKTKRGRIASRSHNESLEPRPAQLETIALDRGDNTGFTLRKKTLDLIYRKDRKEVQASNVQLAVSNQLETSSIKSVDAPARDEPAQRRRRLRKRSLPKRIDLDAPQFTHANDPLPFYGSSIADPEPEQEHERETNQGSSKITGLGIFGTRYPQHFDVFPLQSGTFFHESTLLGDGSLKLALEGDFIANSSHPRHGTSLTIGGQQFCWNTWTDATSSELGIVFDLIAEQLTTPVEAGQAFSGDRAVATAGSVLQYVLHSVSFSEESERKSFLDRLSELLSGFLGRSQASTAGPQQPPDATKNHALVEVNSRFLIIAIVLFRLCQDSAAMPGEVFQAEDIVKRYAQALIAELLGLGLPSVQATCDEIHRLSMREHGIRSDKVAVSGWVIVMKVLEHARIPRSAFWDLTISAMTTPADMQSSDAQRFETLWREMFTLLPLGEFDTSGLLVPGLRHSIPLEGWSLPQKLLKRVFDSYRNNPIQSPNFNEYCRALLSRCHYLIRQWGWHKCSGIIGTIFDFFGHHNLAHLRNEEVYKSPRFLEELNSSPSLSVEPEDRSFHIFLKILAVTIRRLKQLGLSRDVRNLVARTLPNHNRQYSKEQRIHEHELAALRNHHDLLCTLFWSAPPEERPAVHLIEKLVLPGSSHKEACLTNLRAWNQLARFVVSSNAKADVYAPFMAWQNNIFQQILDQYLSAAVDIEQQFMSLPKDARKDIGQIMLDNMVVKNQAAAMDILYFSVAASLNVMNHCPSLESATFSFNTGQVKKVFTQLNMATKEFDWGILWVALETIGQYTSRLEKALDAQYSMNSDSSSLEDASHTEEALGLLDNNIVSGLFSLTRQTMNLPKVDTATHASSQAACIEKAVILCARLASRFINCGHKRLVQYFTPGNYGLFERLPAELGLSERRYLPLFVATLIKNNVFDFKDIGSAGVLGIWMTSIVKPHKAVFYEAYLAETLKQHGFPFLQKAVIIGSNPDYNMNRDFFGHGILYMRKSFLNAGPGHRQQLRTDYGKVLRVVMQQMRADIKALELDSAEHQQYVKFIREIVALIKSHGADICAVDTFYYQVSREYAPAVEDPQLFTATIIAYGLRLGEGETTVVSTIFSSLWSHFKLSMNSGRLDAETNIIEKGMKDDNILSFVLSRMLPATIRASLQSSDVWPLMDVYCNALRGLFDKSSVPREVPDNMSDDVLGLLGSVLNWARDCKEGSSLGERATSAQIHVFTQLVALCNILRPTLICWSLQRLLDLQDLADEVTSFAQGAVNYLDGLSAVTKAAAVTAQDVYIRDLLIDSTQAGPCNSLPEPNVNRNNHVDSFSKQIISEVRKDWVVTPDTITIRMPPSSTQSGTQTIQGVKNDLGMRGRGLVAELRKELRLWIQEMGDKSVGRRGYMRPRRRFSTEPWLRREPDQIEEI